jgi:hypothetical protein
MMSDISPELAQLYKEANIYVDISKGSFPHRWIARIYDDPGFLFIEETFFFKRSATNFSVRFLNDVSGKLL